MPTSKKIARYLLLLLVIIIAIFGCLHIWSYYSEEPWTRDGRVRADVYNVAPDVSGLVTDVQVQDNQEVKKGDLLFRIDIARANLNVQQAQADLESSQAAYQQAQANITVAQANIRAAKKEYELAKKNAQRYIALDNGAASKLEIDTMRTTSASKQAAYEQKRAVLEQAQANLAQKKAAVGIAEHNLDLAKLNRQRADVKAPDDGTLSNFSLRVGNYVRTGEPIAAIINRQQLYVVGYFEETKLKKIHLGDRARVKLMGESEVYEGHVQGIASGIEDRERDRSSGLLANVNPTFTWVRLAQRIPVKIVLDAIPHDNLGFVAGRTVSVEILDKDKDKDKDNDNHSDQPSAKHADQ
ncbi:HlyD family secretion protein [Brackiella oedipodis]|uniref:HlyD family secretion protein n=1 Tax=Brackiella oedipodis TaxID=124225 RepID=UPI00068487E0|nr:HlyD family secretion protein [Brackiella oedipodis]